MPRRNLCPNPALGAPGVPDDTGWSPGDGAGSAVTVSGFDRANAYRVTSGSFCKTPRSAVTVGQAYTVSLYGRSLTAADDTVQFVLQWLRSDDSVISSVGGVVPGGFPAAGTIIRCAATGTAPATAARCEAVLFDYNAGFSSIELTMCLVEETATLDTYADGATTGWVWDATPGTSTSAEVPGITGALTGIIPATTAATAGTVTTSGVSTATPPPPVAVLAGALTASGTTAALAPVATGALTGTPVTTGQTQATSPAAASASTVAVTAAAQLTVTAPATRATLADTQRIAWPPRARSITVRRTAHGTISIR